MEGGYNVIFLARIHCKVINLGSYRTQDKVPVPSPQPPGKVSVQYFLNV